MVWRRRWLGKRSGVLTATIAALAVAAGPAGCGGDGSPSSGGDVLFAGSAAELVPHPAGREATFRVTAVQDGRRAGSGFTSTVTRDDADGTFVTRYVSSTGAVAESTSRDRGDEIVVERFVNDPGGPNEELVAPEPPVGVVRTPVVAGEAIESGFARTLELELQSGGSSERRQVLFVGRARRVPLERGVVPVAGGSYPDAIRYQVSGSGETRLPVLGESVVVTVDVAGDEWFAPGVGGVKEVLTVTVRAGAERAVIELTTEREGAPPSG